MKAIGDMKHGLTGDRPQLSLIGEHSEIYQCRGTAYGAAKYSRGNYHGPAPEGVAPDARIMGYVDAAMRHLRAVAQAYNVALGTGGDTRAAIALPDMMASGGFPASGLPHLAHAIAGLGIAIECAVADGLLPADPGQPWKAGAPEASLPQKDDPAAERARVEALGAAARDVERARAAIHKPVCMREIGSLRAARYAEILRRRGSGEIDDTQAAAELNALMKPAVAAARPRFEVVDNTPEAIAGRPSEAGDHLQSMRGWLATYEASPATFICDHNPQQWKRDAWPWAVVDNGAPEAVNDV